MSPFRSTARARLILPAVLVLGLASAAQAQTGVANPPTAPSAVPTRPAQADAQSPAPLGEVTVDAARQDPLRFMDPKKRAQFDAEAAKQDANHKYLTSRPPMSADSKGISDPNEMSVDYPGLHTLTPAN